MIKKQNKFGMSCLKDYKDALYSCLVQLKPKACLEIGTHIGGTTEVFETYFREHCPDGYLVTGDVNTYNKLESKNVKQVIVKSRIPFEELIKHHSDLDPKETQYSENSRYINELIYWAALRKAKSIDTFDFIFIDGNHTKESFEKDLQLSLNLLSDDGYILIDDVPSNLECSEYFYEKIKPSKKFKIYEFEDWSSPVGAVLLKPAEIPELSE